MYVGITDSDWYRYLKNAECDEVNFWKPGGQTNFRALKEGELFLFKLHSPNDYIVGSAFFLKFSILPSSLAWEVFGIANGTKSLDELNNRVQKYKRQNPVLHPNPQIGCVILSTPVFFERSDWIPVPQDWSRSIVQGKSYDTTTLSGALLFEQVQIRLQKYGSKDTSMIGISENRYGKEQTIKPRIGQGAFKILIADAYHRRCAVTGEKTLPVLEAAHIKPYSLHGPNEISNGLLLRRDYHTLFDRGYITIDRNFVVEVSRRIKEDFGNGKEYYSHHGQKLIVLPSQIDQLPDSEFLAWHNENIYLG